jgi:hypothetical protein
MPPADGPPRDSAESIPLDGVSSGAGVAKRCGAAFPPRADGEALAEVAGMKANEVVSRAQASVAQGCKYVLGKGGFSPASKFPWSSRGECDCSGFVAWCLGISRQTDNPWYAKQNGGWVETSAMVRDAASPYGFFDQVPWVQATPGMLVVYGDSKKNGKTVQGHVGVVSSVDAAGPTHVIHCSSGNYKRTGDAIRETGPDLWKSKGIVVRCAFVA